MHFIIQMSAIVFLVIIVVIQILLFLNVSARMTAIEQKQIALERHLDVLRDAQINIQSFRSYQNQ
jgi:hypothetical protein